MRPAKDPLSLHLAAEAGTSPARRFEFRTVSDPVDTRNVSAHVVGDEASLFPFDSVASVMAKPGDSAQHAATSPGSECAPTWANSAA